VAKNDGNILSQLLDEKMKKKAWSLGQWRQARGYGAVDQGVIFFSYREPPHWSILDAFDKGAMYCSTPLLTAPCYFA
jgi:hypothetical protein